MYRLPAQACSWPWDRAWGFLTHSSSTAECSCSCFSAVTRPVSGNAKRFLCTHPTSDAFYFQLYMVSAHQPPPFRSVIVRIVLARIHPPNRFACVVALDLAPGGFLVRHEVSVLCAFVDPTRTMTLDILLRCLSCVFCAKNDHVRFHSPDPTAS